MVRVLVTGGASNDIGYEVLKELEKNNVDIIVVDELEKENCSFPTNQITYYQRGMDKDLLIPLFIEEKIDYVIHLMNRPIQTNSIKDSFEQSEESLTMTIEVLEACVATKIKKIIFPSTIAVYGESKDGLLDENAEMHPILFEGFSKKLEEQYIKNYHSMYGLTYSILRFASIYGQVPTHSEKTEVIPFNIERLIHSKSPIILGSGEQQRDFIYISDAAAAIHASLTKGDNEIINISTEHEFSINEVITIIQSYIKNDRQPVYKIEREGDVKTCRTSTEKARSILQWEPKIDLTQGIKQTVEEFKKAYSKKQNSM